MEGFWESTLRLAMMIARERGFLPTRMGDIG